MVPKPGDWQVFRNGLEKLRIRLIGKYWLSETKGLVPFAVPATQYPVRKGKRLSMIAQDLRAGPGHSLCIGLRKPVLALFLAIARFIGDPDI